MDAEKVTSIRELDSRLTDGIQVRLLWGRNDGRVWVSVLNTRSGERFAVDVEEDEQPIDVFHHPFAYAAHHGVDTDVRHLCLTQVKSPS